MRINHIALYVNNLEKMKLFYEKYFNAKPNKMYHNQKTGLKTYFLEFKGECLIEIMSKENLNNIIKDINNMGYIHIVLGRVHTTQSDTNTGQPNKRNKHTVKLVIPRTHATECLQPTEKTFYLISLFIQFPVIIQRFYPVLLRRYYWVKPQPPCGQPGFVILIRPVHQQINRLFQWPDAFQQQPARLRVRDVAGRQF
jgi:lactoylglutathione lyase